MSYTEAPCLGMRATSRRSVWSAVREDARVAKSGVRPGALAAQRGVKKGASDYHPDARVGYVQKTLPARPAPPLLDPSRQRLCQHSAKFRSERAIRKTRAETSALAVRASS